MADPTPTERVEGLLARHRADDPAARDALLEASFDRLRVLARKMFRKNQDLRAFDETDDVLNKAMVRLHAALSQVRPDTVRGFYKLASNHIRWVLYDLARDHKDGRLSYVAETPDVAAPEDGPRTPAEWGEFHDAVGRLPEEEREVLDLLVYQGLGQEAAAAVLGVSVRTVKRRWQDARLRLRGGGEP